MSRTDEPVGYTCPMIDEVVDAISDSLKETDVDESATKEELLECLQNIKFSLDNRNTLGILEDIRSANSELRDWGLQNATDADHYEELYNTELGRADELQDKVDDLEVDVQNLEDELSNIGTYVLV